MSGSRGSLVTDQTPCVSDCIGQVLPSHRTTTPVALGAFRRKVTLRSGWTSGETTGSAKDGLERIARAMTTRCFTCMDVILVDDNGVPAQAEHDATDGSISPQKWHFGQKTCCYQPFVKRILLAGLCFAAAVGSRADVVVLQNGTKTECHVLSLFNQKLEIADKDGSISHVDFQQVRRIDFNSKTAAITTRDHLIS